MFRSWEVAPEKREQAKIDDDREWAYRERVADRYEVGRGKMWELFTLPFSQISETPSDELQQMVRDITKSQSLVKLLPYYTNLLATSPVHPKLTAEIVKSLTETVSTSYKRAPVARNLRDLFVEVDAVLSTPEGQRNLTDPFLGLVAALINDADQTCIAFVNNHMFLSENQIAGIRQAIKEKDTRFVADSLAHFWQNTGEFADNDTIQAAYVLWMAIGEQASEDPLFPLPRTFKKAASAFEHILESDSVRLIDRRDIAAFYDEAQKVAGMFACNHREIKKRTYYSITLV